MKSFPIFLTLVVFSRAAISGDHHVDLLTVMKLAGANNDEVEYAEVRHTQAVIESRLAWQQFWPSLKAGAGFRRYDGSIQEVGGTVFEADKRQYTVGGALMVDWAPGDLYFRALSTKQEAGAAEDLAEAARRDVVLDAVERYYEMLCAEANTDILADDLRLTQEYARQLEGAVEAGTAFRADLLRVKTQESRAQLRIRQAEEARDLAAANLAEILRLPPETSLRPAKVDLVPTTLVKSGETDVLVSDALANRPEVKASVSAESAAALEAERARVAPMIPKIYANYGAGGLGGGKTGVENDFGGQQDFFVGIGWTIGPGGLFDRDSKRLALAKHEAAQLRTRKVRAEVGRDVVSAEAIARSNLEQIAINEKTVAAAEELVKVATERQASQIGVVLEYLLAQQELTLARQDHIQSVCSYNQAQHRLRHAVGHAEPQAN